VFKVQGLREVADDLAKHDIAFYIVSGAHTEKDIVHFVAEHDAGLLVTDFSPLRIQRGWKQYVAEHVGIRCIEVDAHNVVPAWIASQKSEVGARTLRPKLHRLLPEYIEKFPKLVVHPYQIKGVMATAIDWKKLESDPTVDASVPAVAVVGGMKAGQAVLESFLADRLPRYGSERNDPQADAQSNLSPYLHYGMIAPGRAALEAITVAGAPISALIDAQKNKAKIDPKAEPTLIDSVSAFLEEIIVRRELSDNFCLYNPDTYDTTECFAGWAITSLRAHAKTTRDYIYTQEQFEKAQTHDELWNACQMEMVQTGKMHGYMRMYWAKKILEWTKSPEDAMAIAIYLNDRYELDGRDPNGYAGIAWSIGGVHDRAWFTRPIFGLVRYMARSGCESKFDVPAYIERFTPGKALF
jgi:deoxyribodipyrimidine photo-lyase